MLFKHINDEHRFRSKPLKPIQQHGLRRLVNALRFSRQGLIQAYRSEAAFREELWLLLLIAPATYFIPVSMTERLLLIGAWLFVLIAELFNSALEAVVDRIGPEHHPLSGHAKDMGSAAVLLSMLLCALIWAAVLL